MHITHGKAGSTWIDLILRKLFEGQVAPRLWEMPERFSFEKYPVYAAVFMTRDKFLSYPELAPIKRFVVIRDLRDTLISQYFSMRDTHELDPGGIVQERRDILRACSFEEGLSYLLDKALIKQAAIQQSWVGSGEILLKYEDLIARDLELFTELFLGKMALPVTREQIEQAVTANRFETVFQRKLGEEDATSHGRKGAPGDWQNHFTRAFAQQFQDKYGALLAATGYESDSAWVERIS
jgi:lipopolysaccharide transport system ATP-binding protein